MNVTQYAVSTTPTLILGSNTATAGEDMGATVKNLGSAIVYLGDEDIDATSAAGYPLAVNEVVTLNVPGGELAALWAATASGTASVAVLAS